MHAATIPPLAQDLTLSSVVQIRDLDHVDALYEGREQGWIYARDGHPNALRLAAELARLEHSEAGVVVSSGMGAIAAVCLDRLRCGDRIVASRELYGKTLALLGDRLSRLGIEVDLLDMADASAIDSALARRPSLMLIESLTNPSLRAVDMVRLSEQCRIAGTLLAVDSTFTPPPILRPIQLGADLVIHSLTKFISGHSDVTLGAALGRADLIGSISETASTFGLHAGALDCWLASRGMATLELRVERACANAGLLAEFLQSQPGIRSVLYPGLQSHPDHAWMGQHAALFGFMLGIELAGGRDSVNRLFRGFRMIPFCPSLGDVRTTVSHPASTSHRGLSIDERARLGIGDGLVRVSVGIEPIERLVADFQTALNATYAP